MNTNGAEGDLRKPSTAQRPALLVMDVEGTIFESRIRLPGTMLQSTIWQSIANALGPEAVAEEVESHSAWHHGEFSSYLNWMKATIEIHRRHGLSESVFGEVVRSAQYNRGVSEFFAKLDRSTWEPVLVSGGFRELARRAQEDFGIYHAFAACEYFFGSDGRLNSYNLLPCDFEGKVDFINLLLREYRLGGRDWVYVGDGANDVPIAQLASLSVGFNPAPQLAKVVTHVASDFTVLLPLLDRWNRQRHSEERPAMTQIRLPFGPVPY